MIKFFISPQYDREYPTISLALSSKVPDQGSGKLIVAKLTCDDFRSAPASSPNLLASGRKRECAAQFDSPNQSWPFRVG